MGWLTVSQGSVLLAMLLGFGLWWLGMEIVDMIERRDDR